MSDPAFIPDKCPECGDPPTSWDHGKWGFYLYHWCKGCGHYFGRQKQDGKAQGT